VVEMEGRVELEKTVWYTYGKLEAVLSSLREIKTEVGHIAVILHSMKYKDETVLKTFTELLDKYGEDIRLLMSRLESIVQLLQEYKNY